MVPNVIDVEFVAGPRVEDDGWLIWLAGDWLEPYYGGYWVAADSDERPSGWANAVDYYEITGEEEF